MKKMLCILFLMPVSFVFSQSEFNINQFVNAFGTCVNSNIHLYDKGDIDVINRSEISRKQGLEQQFDAWIKIPVADNFTDGTPEQKAVFQQLDKICAPLWTYSSDTDAEAIELLKQIDLEFGKLENGKVAEYLFIRLLLLSIIETMILGEPAY